MNALTGRNHRPRSEPFDLFRQWMDEAEKSEINDPNAMCLATVDAKGLPNARMVLLKCFDDAGFVFYTNKESAKGRELAAQAQAAGVLHWKSLRRQFRFRGPVEQVSEAESDAYFASRRARQPHRRLGQPAVAPARKPIRAGKGGRASGRAVQLSGRCRARPIGAATASVRSRSNSGQTSLSACTKDCVIPARGRRATGIARRSIREPFRAAIIRPSRRSP